MRELKFKAKRIDNGEWVTFSLFDGVSKITWEIYDKATVCQFTGVTDKQGNDIYEGDEVIDEDLRAVVVFKEGIQQTCLVYPEGDEFRVGRHILERVTLTGKNKKD